VAAPACPLLLLYQSGSDREPRGFDATDPLPGIRRPITRLRNRSARVLLAQFRDRALRLFPATALAWASPSPPDPAGQSGFRSYGSVVAGGQSEACPPRSRPVGTAHRSRACTT